MLTRILLGINHSKNMYSLSSWIYVMYRTHNCVSLYVRILSNYLRN